MPAKASKPAAEKPPAKEVKPVGKEEKTVSPPITPVEKPASLPVKLIEKPVGLPKPAAQPPAKLAKDLGAEKFLAKCLITLKDVASQEDISKAVNDSWAKINGYKLQSAIAVIKAKFAPTGMGNPAGAIILGAGDAVDKDRNVLGATVYLLKEKSFINLKLLGKSVVEYEQLGSGRSVIKMTAPKYTIDPASVESTPISDLDVYNAILAASIPKEELAKHEFKQYEIVAFEGKVRGFGEEFTNPMATKNGDLKFTLSPLAAVEWDAAAWVHARKFGDAYLAMLGEAELNEYRKMDIDGKAAFLDAMLRDQIVMVCGKVGKEVFKEYKGYNSLELDVITLALRPDELDPVVYESRPTRMAKPATSAVDNAISGQSIGDQSTPEQPPAEQPVGGEPSVLPPEVLQRIAEIKAINGKEDAIIQQDAIDIMTANADLAPLTMLEALNMLHDNEKEKAAKAAGSLAPPPHDVDYTNPEDDTPALKELRTAAVRAHWQGFTREEFLAWAAKYNRKNVNAETLPKDVFQAFIAANKPGGK